MSFSDAFQHVKKCRYFIQPNDGFKKQLQSFNRELIAKRKAAVQSDGSLPLANEESKGHGMSPSQDIEKYAITGPSKGGRGINGKILGHTMD